MKRSLSITGLAAVALLSLGGRSEHPHIAGTPPPFLDAPTPWADSVLSTLSLDERIAQLMMVAAYSNKDAKHVQEIEQLVRTRDIGGLIFFQGGPGRQAALTNRYQAIARTPLLIGMDLEWGLAMRLDSTMRFPKQMTLGALADDANIERMGEEIAREMKRLGVQVSFSPVADVNNNPANPVINDRSFGEDRELVARKAIAYMKGLQKGGVIATAKHFPGHGDTDTDSHLALPVIAQTRARLDSIELYPFQRMVDEGLSAMMVGHLQVPALDTTPNTPTTLSKPVVSDLLEREIGFRGLVFTDALNMKGVTKNEKPGEIELRALLAGNDMLLFPVDPVKAIDRIRQAVDSGLVPREMIDHKCLKVLRAKEWAGLGRPRTVDPRNIAEDLNTMAAKVLRRQLYADALTVVRNDGTLPIHGLDSLRIASLVIGDSLHNGFQRALGRYAPVTEFRCDKVMKPDSATALLRRLKAYDLVIASVHNTSSKVEKEFGVPQITLDLLRRLGDQQKLVFTLFTNPYRLTRAFGAQRWNGLVVAYEENDDTQDLAAQLLFGAIPAKGHLPVTASSYFAAGDGLAQRSVGRLRYVLPEEDGITTASLKGIDAIVQEGIAAKAYPGCQVLVAQNGEVVWNKAYGKPSYEAKRAVRTDDIYDLASVTKVASTTLALMKLVDERRVDVDRTLGDYLPETKPYPAYAAMKLSDILTHQAGLKPFVPFYKRLSAEGRLKPGIASDTADATHTLRVADRIYIPASYRDTLVTWILRTPLDTPGQYLYSDMGMYLLQRVIERVSGQPLDQFVQRTYYAPLGLGTLGYRPLTRFPKDRIMPTENEKEFRRQQIQGDVHDPGAALMGGVAGHAGLFGDANDLAVVLQLLLNGGTYGGQRYLSDSTVALFTKCRFCAPDGRSTGNRRGLGWDKPQPRGQKGPACDCVSYASFGHTGFTGTMIWADPEDRSLYVFLSNRVYPDAENKKLSELDIRTRIQSVVHGAIAGKAERSIQAAPRPFRFADGGHDKYGVFRFRLRHSVHLVERARIVTVSLPNRDACAPTPTRSGEGVRTVTLAEP
ncbi:MAG: glycoside hydrolase family 3 N-terminal domain-containing protein [Flavobacteriales bacterium]